MTDENQNQEQPPQTPGDIDPSLSRFNNFGDLAKAYMHEHGLLTQKVGARLPANSTSEDRAAFVEAIKREMPSLREDSAWQGFEREILDGGRDQVKTAVQQEIADYMKAKSEAIYGENLGTRQEIAKEQLSRVMGDNESLREVAERMNADNNPVVAELAYALHQATKEHSVPDASSPTPMEPQDNTMDLIAELHSLTRAPEYTDLNNPMHKAFQERDDQIRAALREKGISGIYGHAAQQKIQSVLAPGDYMKYLSLVTGKNS